MLTWIWGYFWNLHKGVRPRLEWGHERALFSHAVAAVSRFPLRGPRDLWLSLESFPRGFPTGLSHESRWCESILGIKAEAVQGKQIPVNGLRHLGVSWNGGTTLQFLSPFLWRAPLLEMRWECREFFPEQVGKGSLISSYEPKRSSSGCGRDPRASS